jgi:hypothetical protein
MIRAEAGPKEPELDIEQFVEVYRWVSVNLPSDLRERFDEFVDGDLPALFPHAAGDVYHALAADRDPNLRLLAAISGHNAVRVAGDDGRKLLAHLSADSDWRVRRQARQTLRDLPSLLRESERPQE